jgi:hypothetical protein
VKKIVAEIRDNPIKSVLLAVLYVFSCRVVYLVLRDFAPGWSVALACIGGLVLGLFGIAYAVEPIMKFLDAKVDALFRIRRH